jgi:hypothetical protein
MIAANSASVLLVVGTVPDPLVQGADLKAVSKLLGHPDHRRMVELAFARGTLAFYVSEGS